MISKTVAAALVAVLFSSTAVFAAPDRLRVVGSWNSLTLYKNLE